MNTTNELKEELGFANIDIIKALAAKVRQNKKANGVHKYMKKFLKMYNWKDREKLIIEYTYDKINPETNRIINKMKQRYNYIQANFDNFVSFLKEKTKHNGTKNNVRNT